MTVPVCQVCGKPLPPLAVAQLDPHCSSTCARVTSGHPLPFVASPGNPKKAA